MIQQIPAAAIPNAVTLKPADLEATIVIPTVATPSVLVPGIASLAASIRDRRVNVVVAVNPKDVAGAEKAIRESIAVWNEIVPASSPATLTVVTADGPIGFGNACNLGFRTANEHGGIGGVVVYWNDDLRPHPDWLDGILLSLKAETIQEWSEFADETGARPERPISGYIGNGKGIGLIGPVTNLAAGIQMMTGPAGKRCKEIGPEKFGHEWIAAHPAGETMTATFLSGFCVGVVREAVRDLDLTGPSRPEGGLCGQFEGDTFPVGGYEDNDLCARAWRLGWRPVVAVGSWVSHIGHQSFDALFPDALRGMRNRVAFYDRWAGRVQGEANRIAAVYRILLAVPNDIGMFVGSLQAISRLVDHVEILLTGPVLASVPAEHHQNVASRMAPQYRSLVPSREAPLAQQARHLQQALTAIVQTFEGTRTPTVSVRAWTGEFNERDERNAALVQAEAVADWILSVDHDEIPEATVTRGHLERLMNHPDPMVMRWDVAFATHWDSDRLVNISHPWGDEGNYTGGMRGFRFYRAMGHRVIAGGNNGLHCGNVPGSDLTGVRTAGITVRHYGYIDARDRERKQRRYELQDPNPNAQLIGGSSYGHITRGENLRMSAWSDATRVGLTMLAYEGESAEDYARTFDQLYGVVDAIVIVWTSEAEIPSDLARVFHHFGVIVIRHLLNDDLCGARTAGIDHLRGLARADGTPAINWALFLDPDEHFHVRFPVEVRRMAQSGDTFAWLFRFQNQHADGSASPSEAMRMVRIDLYDDNEQPLLYLSGRVHESFEESVRRLSDAGIRNIVRVCPSTLLNTGLNLTPEQMQAKLDRYRRLLELDLQDDPKRGPSWVSLGLYWDEMGAPVTAQECFRRAVAVAAPSMFLAHRELGLSLIRMGAPYIVEAANRLPAGHPMRVRLEEFISALGDYAPPVPRHGARAAGAPPVAEHVAMATLPAFPFDEPLPEAGEPAETKAPATEG
jgi:hypothetical protein